MYEARSAVDCQGSQLPQLPWNNARSPCDGDEWLHLMVSSPARSNENMEKRNKNRAISFFHEPSLNFLLLKRKQWKFSFQMKHTDTYGINEVQGKQKLPRGYTDSVPPKCFKIWYFNIFNFHKQKKAQAVIVGRTCLSTKSPDFLSSNPFQIR